MSATGKPPDTRGHPGCNDKSKDHPRAHERRIKPQQDLASDIHGTAFLGVIRLVNSVFYTPDHVAPPTPTTHQLSNFNFL
jgi:hypothetical protein